MTSNATQRSRPVVLARSSGRSFPNWSELMGGLMKRLLAVGVEYTDKPIDGVEIERLGSCQANVAPDKSAFSLYQYDAIIINPASYSHFLFGAGGE